MEKSDSKPPSLPKLEFIDALRGLAILMVVFVHTSLLWSHQTSAWLTKFSFGTARGVQLFFMVSAFTLCYAVDFRKNNFKEEWKFFFIRRWFRIFPLWLFFLLVYGSIYATRGNIFWNVMDKDLLSVPNLLSHLFMFQTISPEFLYKTLIPGGASIVTEVHFYLTFPFLYRYCTSASKSLKLLFFTTLLALFHKEILSNFYPENYHGWNSFYFYHILNQYFTFVIGVLIYHIWLKKDTKFDPLDFWILVGLTLGLFYLEADRYISMIYVLAFLLTLIIHFKPKWIVNNWTVFLGKISYSLYFVHFLFAYLIYELFNIPVLWQVDLSYFIYYILFILVSLPLSYLSYLYIEKTGIRLGEKCIHTLLK